MPTLRALAAAALAAGAALPAAALATPPVPPTGPHAPVAAATPAARGPIEVTVGSVTPRVATPTTDVVLTVVVTNHGRTPLAGVRATADLGNRRFTERGEVGRWLASTTEESGETFASASSPAPAATARLAPGASQTVTITVPRTSWRPGRPFAAVPVDIRVTAQGAPEARARTVVPFVGTTPEYVPMRVAWVVPLTAPPSPELFTSDGAATLAAWTGAIGPASAVRERLAAARSTPVTWFVDPTLVEAPTFVAGAGSVAAPLSPSPSPSLSPGATPTPSSSSSTLPTPSATPQDAGPTPTDTATAERRQKAIALTKGLVDALATVPSTQTVWALPPGDADTAALLERQPDDDLAGRLYPAGPTPLDTALGKTVPRATAWPADGVWSATRADEWSGATNSYPMTSVLASTSTVDGPTGFTPTAVHRASDGTGILAYDEELSDIAGGTARGVASLGRTDVVQRFLAESLVLLGEREGTARDVVVALPRTSTTDVETLRELWAATANLPWLQPTTLPALAAELPTAPVTRFRSPSQALAPVTPITPSSVGDAERRTATAEGLAGVIPPDRAAFTSVWGEAGAQQLSARWRASRTAWASLGAATDSALTKAAGAVQVSPANVNLLADAGAVAITVTNDLPYPVSDVRLRLTPGNSKLRVDAQPQPLDIKARSRATVRVNVTALGAGEVPLVAAVSTPSGTALGTPRTVTMNVRPPGEWILYVVGGVFALVLVGGVVRALRRPQTRAQRHDLSAPAPHPDAVERPTRLDAPADAAPPPAPPPPANPPPPRTIRPARPGTKRAGATDDETGPARPEGER